MIRFLFIWCILPSYVFAKPFLIEAKHEEEVLYGSGFFIDNKGIALTSYHVVDHANDITIIIDGKKYDASIVGYDEVLDVAALKVPFTDNAFYVIDECLASNNGYIILINGSIKADIITDSLHNLIIQAKVRRGNSGSPFAVNGNTCGLVTGFHKQTGYAILAKIDKNKIRDIVSGNIFVKKDLQIYITDLTKDMMRTLNFDLKQKLHGVLVTYSKNHLLQPWDVITKINDREIYNTNDFLEELGSIYESENAKIVIIRNGIVLLLVL